jgi:ectoine hydroxylase-related dioxygenase (phytanoyl-CoA dioxygenase family)
MDKPKLTAQQMAFMDVFYKMALYLAPVTATSGAVRVIPGSQRYGDRFAENLHPADFTHPRGANDTERSFSNAVFFASLRSIH